jgi:hypothetical protein
MKIIFVITTILMSNSLLQTNDFEEKAKTLNHQIANQKNQDIYLKYSKEICKFLSNVYITKSRFIEIRKKKYDNYKNLLFYKYSLKNRFFDIIYCKNQYQKLVSCKRNLFSFVIDSVLSILSNGKRFILFRSNFINPFNYINDVFLFDKNIIYSLCNDGSLFILNAYDKQVFEKFVNSYFVPIKSKEDLIRVGKLFQFLLKYNYDHEILIDFSNNFILNLLSKSIFLPKYRENESEMMYLFCTYATLSKGISMHSLNYNRKNGFIIDRKVLKKSNVIVYQ